MFKERFTLIRVSGFLLCIGGALLIISRGDFNQLLSHGIGIGEMAFIGCAISWATYTLIGRFVSAGMSSLLVITYASVIGTVVLFGVALVTKGSGLFTSIAGLSVSAGLHLLYLAVFATVVGFVWFQEGIKELGAAKAAVFIYFMPVSAVFWAYLILHEKLTLVLIMGAVFVITGIYLVNKKEALGLTKTS
jgi:drug/metabolite transporter (DMT)-like permease